MAPTSGRWLGRSCALRLGSRVSKVVLAMGCSRSWEPPKRSIQPAVVLVTSICSTTPRFQPWARRFLAASLSLAVGWKPWWLCRRVCPTEPLRRRRQLRFQLVRDPAGACTIADIVYPNPAGFGLSNYLDELLAAKRRSLRQTCAHRLDTCWGSLKTPFSGMAGVPPAHSVAREGFCRTCGCRPGPRPVRPGGSP